LAISWLFMAAEGPIIVRLVSGGPDAKVLTAAFLIVMSIAIFIESPVIDLLSTGTTMGKGRQSYVVISKFAWYMIVFVTIVHFLVTWTPLYWLVTLQFLQLDPAVAKAAHVPLMIMVPWSGFVGWRRKLHGLMIAKGETKMIGFGTTVRVLTLLTTGFGLASTGMGALVAAAWALLASVAAEAAFIHLVSRKVIQAHYMTDEPGFVPLTMKQLWAFHIPLTLSSMVILSQSLFISRALAAAPDSVLAMAAWQVAISVIWLFRTMTFALPEVVISQFRKHPQAPQVLKRFCLTVGLSLSVLLLVFGLTPLSTLVYGGVLRSDPTIVQAAIGATLVCVLLPWMNAWMSYIRAALTAYHLTVARLTAISLGVGSLVACLFIGVTLKLPGVLVAGLSITFAHLVEIAWLNHAWQRGRPKPEFVEAQA
jgi:hypothetical protein